jgi:hypothetical protein
MDKIGFQRCIGTRKSILKRQFFSIILIFFIFLFFTIFFMVLFYHLHFWSIFSVLIYILFFYSNQLFYGTRYEGFLVYVVLHYVVFFFFVVCVRIIGYMLNWWTILAFNVALEPRKVYKKYNSFLLYYYFSFPLLSLFYLDFFFRFCLCHYFQL